MFSPCILPPKSHPTKIREVFFYQEQIVMFRSPALLARSRTHNLWQLSYPSATHLLPCRAFSATPRCLFDFTDDPQILKQLQEIAAAQVQPVSYNPEEDKMPENMFSPWALLNNHEEKEKLKENTHMLLALLGNRLGKSPLPAFDSPDFIIESRLLSSRLERLAKSLSNCEDSDPTFTLEERISLWSLAGKARFDCWMKRLQYYRYRMGGYPGLCVIDLCVWIALRERDDNYVKAGQGQQPRGSLDRL